MPDNLTITVEFSGGLEILFDNNDKHAVTIPSTSADGARTTVGDLIEHVCQTLLTDPRKELFVVDGAIRPGVLVLINDADWELEGEDRYELQSGDSVLFVSTLHGG